ncbi:MAG: hypothetical protein QF898_07295 [SAR202 cluster bacterium]|jgi:hypothetical protein|nr:hypothetical protein [SAR202 cluster bacterium]MDP6713822.1 hypothetical protein [SAR202 cluster bacterium]
MSQQDVTLRITLGDMPMEDSFWVTTAIDTNRTVHHLLYSVFPSSDEAASAVEKTLDIRANPDLPEMYREIHSILLQWNEGASQLTFKSPSGEDILLDDPVSRRMAPSNGQGDTIHIVLEQRLDALTAYQSSGGDRNDFLQWMQGSMLIYFMDKHHYPLPFEPEEHTHDWRLLPIADELEALGFIGQSSTEDSFEITPKGRGFIGNLIAETESYIRRFDVFSDIIPGRGLQPTVFGHGRGLDLRVQIFENQGIDPHRAVFLLRMYDGTLDGYTDSWRADIHELEFFNRLLEPVLDHNRVNDDDLDWVIDQGMEHIQQTADNPRSPTRSRPLKSQNLTD